MGVANMESNTNSFREQIEDDIALLQEQYGYLDNNLAKKEYAFNYWILTYLFGIDGELCPDYVTDYSDKGIDCFVHYEESKELYLIQNKFYDERTAVTRKDVSDFLSSPISILYQGQYKKSQELQKIFDLAKEDSEYKIYLCFYVTNNIENKDISPLIDAFCAPEGIKAGVYVCFYKLDDIKMMYYDERFTDKIQFNAELRTIVKATSLDVRPKDYGMDWMIRLSYVMVNVVDIYKLYVKAKEKNYQLFEENIREYLGIKGINRGIIDTLKDKEDRKNFFYYNNGITVICEKIEKLSGSSGKNQYGAKLKNPQIVNGCQTVNSIAEVLSHYPNDKDLTEEFKEVYVLVKVYELGHDSEVEHTGLAANIVRFTNSQNAITEKAFAASSSYFINLRTDFLSRGVLLAVKQSDKNTYKSTYTKSKGGELHSKNQELFDFFDLVYKNYESAEIQLEKLLKVLLAFCEDGYVGYHDGKSVLKPESKRYTSFSLQIRDRLSTDNMIRLYFTFMKAEKEQKASENKRFPIPYYVLGFLGNSLKGISYKDINDKLDQLFSDKKRFIDIYKFFATLTQTYFRQYNNTNKEDYNVMIKKPIDYVIYSNCLDMTKTILYPDSVRWFLEE